MVGLLCPRLSNWWCNDSTSFPVLFVLVAGRWRGEGGRGEGEEKDRDRLGGQARGRGGVHWAKLAGESRYLTRCCTTGGERRRAATTLHDGNLDSTEVNEEDVLVSLTSSHSLLTLLVYSVFVLDWICDQCAMIASRSLSLVHRDRLKSWYKQIYIWWYIHVGWKDFKVGGICTIIYSRVSISCCNTLHKSNETTKRFQGMNHALLSRWQYIDI